MRTHQLGTLLLLLCFSLLKVEAQEKDKNLMAQFSVLPGLSTNGDSARKITNNLSFNLFAGYNGGVEGFEFGTFANLVTNDVVGAQISGITNIVFGDAQAFQVSGILNYNKGSFEGIQVAGIGSIVYKDFTGMQVGGILATTKNMYGMQVAGLTANSDTIYGFQLGGLATNAKTVVGLQTSGIFNRSDEVYGAQISGIVNVTKELNGAQIGLINVADTVASGVPFGIASFVKHGYKTVDLSYNELFPLTLSLKTGVNELYNVFTGSSNFDSENHLWSIGYGFGSRFHIASFALMEFELTASHLSKDQLDEGLNMLGRLNINFAFEFGKYGQVYFGPSINGYASQVYDLEQSRLGYDIGPKNKFYSDISYDFDKPTLFEGWIGGQVGIRL